MLCSTSPSTDDMLNSAIECLAAEKHQKVKVTSKPLADKKGDVHTTNCGLNCSILTVRRFVVLIM